MGVMVREAMVYSEVVQPWTWRKLTLLPQNLIAWHQPENLF